MDANLARPGELKPCPMCGNTHPNLYELADAFGVECGKCVVQTVMVGRREQAVADWNRRAPVTEDGAAELDRLRTALDKIANMHTGGSGASGIAWAALRAVTIETR